MTKTDVAARLADRIASRIGAWGRPREGTGHRLNGPCRFRSNSNSRPAPAGLGFSSLRVGARGRARPACLYRRAAVAGAASAGGADLRRHRLPHRGPGLVRAGAAALGSGAPRGAGARQRGRADRPRLHGRLPDLGLEPQSSIDPAPPGEGIVIRPGERIAQLVFMRVARPHFTIVSEFDGRGRRGAAAAGRFRFDRHRCRLSKRLM